MVLPILDHRSDNEAITIDDVSDQQMDIEENVMDGTAVRVFGLKGNGQFDVGWDGPDEDCSSSFLSRLSTLNRNSDCVK